MILSVFVLVGLAIAQGNAFVTRTWHSTSICASQTDSSILGSWDDAYALANAAVATMTIDEKIGIVKGTGQLNSDRKHFLRVSNITPFLTTRFFTIGRCVGDTTAVSRLGIPSICLQDGPAGLRLVKNVTGFPSGINTASTFSRRLMRARGAAIGEEFRGKGVQ